MGETVTVIVATYGDRSFWDSYARRAIESAESQDPAPNQLIRSHGTTLQEARNGAVEKATGDWLCFLDADDELEPGYIRGMFSVPGDLRYPRVRYVPDGRKGDAAQARILPERPLLTGNFMVIGTFVRREQFLRVGGFPDYPAYEDWGLWLKCWIDGAKWQLCKRAIYRAHVRKGGRNHLPGNVAQKLYDKIRGEFEPLAKEKGLV